MPSQLQSLEGKIVSGLSLPCPSVVGPHVVGPFRPSPQGSNFLLVPGGKTSSRKLALKFPLRNGALHRADQISTRMSCRRIKPFGTWRQFRGKDPLNGIPRNKTNHKQYGFSDARWAIVSGSDSEGNALDFADLHFQFSRLKWTCLV